MNRLPVVRSVFTCTLGAYLVFLVYLAVPSGHRGNVRAPDDIIIEMRGAAVAPNPEIVHIGDAWDGEDVPTTGPGSWWAGVHWSASSYSYRVPFYSVRGAELRAEVVGPFPIECDPCFRAFVDLFYDDPADGARRFFEIAIQALPAEVRDSYSRVEVDLESAQPVTLSNRSIDQVWLFRSAVLYLLVPMVFVSVHRWQQFWQVSVRTGRRGSD